MSLEGYGDEHMEAHESRRKHMRAHGSTWEHMRGGMIRELSSGK
jgi:hypothetical protein